MDGFFVDIPNSLNVMAFQILNPFKFTTNFPLKTKVRQCGNQQTTNILGEYFSGQQSISQHILGETNKQTKGKRITHLKQSL
jgi:hypothetical protein